MGSKPWWEKKWRNIEDRRMRQPDGAPQIIDVTFSERYIDEDGNIEYEDIGGTIASYNWAAAERACRDAWGPGTLRMLAVESGPVGDYLSRAEEDFDDIDKELTDKTVYFMCAWTQGRPIKREDE